MSDSSRQIITTETDKEFLETLAKMEINIMWGDDEWILPVGTTEEELFEFLDILKNRDEEQ